MKSKILFFTMIFLTIGIKAQDNYQPIDPVNGMKLKESESVTRANEEIEKFRNGSYKSEKLQSEVEHIKSMELKSYEEVKNETQKNSTESYEDQTVSVPKSSENIGQELFPPDNSTSMWKEVDIDKYYDKQADGSYIRKTKKGSNKNTIYIILGIFGLISIIAFLFSKNNKPQNDNSDYEKYENHSNETKTSNDIIYDGGHNANNKLNESNYDSEVRNNHSNTNSQGFDSSKLYGKN